VTTPAIAVEGLRKSYGELEAVRGVSLRVEPGEVVALLGPNGAGKTTIVEILEGHRRRSAGAVSVLGFDPQSGGRALRERIGIVLQGAGIDADVGVAEALELCASYYPAPLDVEAVLDLVGLAEKRRARAKTLSGGQRRRLDLALGLIGDPELLFLDEPTTGFDPAARRQAWAVLDDLRSLGKTILLTSHFMDEVAHLADRAVVISRGRVVAEGAPGSLGAGGRGETVVVRFRLPAGVAAGELPAAIADLATVTGDEVTVTTMHPTELLHTASGWALALGGELVGLSIERPSLEDVYLQLTGEDETADRFGVLR